MNVLYRQIIQNSKFENGHKNHRNYTLPVATTNKHTVMACNKILKNVTTYLYVRII